MIGHGGTWLRACPAITLICYWSVSLLNSATVCAKTSDTDGVYGRLDGDITLEPNMGLQHYRGDTEAALGLQAMYVSTLGLSVQHADSTFLLGKQSVNRGVTSLEFRLCPLFLARWSQSLEMGPRLLDLTLDSFTIGLGAYWDHDRDIGRLRRGMSVSTGVSFPLFGSANGPWLNSTLALRFAEGPAFSAQADVMVGLGLTWALLIDSGLHDDNP